MENQIFRVLHAYNAENQDALALVNVLVYRNSLVLIGYKEEGQPLSSFIHYQFNEIGIEDIYSVQIQMIMNYIPEAFQKAAKKNIYHAEPTYVLIPREEMYEVNGYQMYSDLHSKGSEKVLTDEFASVDVKEYYNYPYRVYNDLDNAFENATFFSYHQNVFRHLKHKSTEGTLVYVSIKSNYIEIIGFNESKLTFCNTFEYKNKADILYFIQAAVQDLNIGLDSSDIYITTIRKEEQEDIFNTLKHYFPNFNEKVTATFGIQPEFWNTYADAFLSH
jgi:hypothetical protein